VEVPDGNRSKNTRLGRSGINDDVTGSKHTHSAGLLRGSSVQAWRAFKDFRHFHHADAVSLAGVLNLNRELTIVSPRLLGQFGPESLTNGFSVPT
jgi:hypothetical protein